MRTYIDKEFVTVYTFGMSIENGTPEKIGRWNPITGNKAFFFLEPENLGQRLKRFIQFPIEMSAEETEKAYQRMLDAESEDLGSPSV